MSMDKYDAIINLPHHVSKTRPRMTMYQRAAQFAPFAALTGHSEALCETARLTQQAKELSDSECDNLNRQIALLLAHIQEHPHVCITHFVPDPYKTGGSYVTHSGILSKWDEYEHIFTFDDGTRIPAGTIVCIHYNEPAQ